MGGTSSVLQELTMASLMARTIPLSRTVRGLPSIPRSTLLSSSVIFASESPRRHLNLLEYQSKGLLQEHDVTVQNFVLHSTAEAEKIPPWKEFWLAVEGRECGRTKTVRGLHSRVEFI